MPAAFQSATRKQIVITNERAARTELLHGLVRQGLLRDRCVNTDGA